MAIDPKDFKTILKNYDIKPEELNVLQSHLEHWKTFELTPLDIIFAALAKQNTSTTIRFSLNTSMKL